MVPLQIAEKLEDLDENDKREKIEDIILSYEIANTEGGTHHSNFRIFLNHLN